VQARPGIPTLLSRGAPTVAALLAITLWGIALANVVNALRDPLELEVREGTSWLYALAQSSGQSLYDPTRVAFVNMNHGPLDPILKSWLHAVLPMLPGQIVVRAFAAVLPFALLGALWSRIGRFAVAAAWSGGVYLFLLGLGPAQFLIGRSDPTAMCLLCGLLWVGERWFRPGRRSSTNLARSVAFGALSSAVVLTNWRMAPAVAMLTAVLLVEASGERTFSLRRGFALLGTALGGGAFVAAAVLLLSFHGDLGLYYRHFFGVFTPASGWGTRGQMPFDGWPADVADGRMLIHLGLAAALAGSLVVAFRHRDGSRRTTCTWIAGLALLWWVCAWGYALNHGAGGPYYFAPWYVLAAYFVATRLDWKAIPTAVSAAILVCLAAGLPWVGTWLQTRSLARAAAESRTFVHQLSTVTPDEYIYSEDVHLFRRAYRGEAVDMGDMAEALAQSGYLGKDFTATFRRNAASLHASPPPFVAVGAKTIVTTALQRELAAHYTEVLRSGPVILAQGGLPIVVFRRNAP
jgi:hypothetical protein